MRKTQFWLADLRWRSPAQKTCEKGRAGDV